MSTTTIKTRMLQRHDTEANWLLKEDFIPLNGELIIYDIDENHSRPRMKIGNGKTNLKDLPFSTEARPDVTLTLEGVAADAKAVGDALKQSDWNQTDETQLDFIKNKPTEKDAIAILAEMNFVEPVANADGSVFTDGDGNVYVL